MNRCNKLCYDSKKDAQTAKNFRYRGRRRGKSQRRGLPKALKVYFCPDCRAWHLATLRK